MIEDNINNETNPKQYSTEEKLQLECQKLDREVKKLKIEVENIQRPFFRQPTTIWGAIPLLISVLINFQQCSKTKNAEERAQINYERTMLNIEKAKHENDSLIKRKEEITHNISLAKLQLQSVLDTIGNHFTKLADKFDSTTPSPKNREAIVEVKQELTNINQAGKYAIANIDMKSSSFKISAIKDMPLARQKWQEGFDNLISNRIEDAISSFTASENAYNGYHHAYELARYLRSKANSASDPEARKEIIRTVLSKYSEFAPPDAIIALKKEVAN